MAFDIHAFDEGGELDPAALEVYLEDLLDAFEASPEAADGPAPTGRLYALLELAATHEASFPASMDGAGLQRALSRLLPPGESVPAPLVAELLAFWRFVDREFTGTNAGSCVAFLEKLRPEPGDPPPPAEATAPRPAPPSLPPSSRPPVSDRERQKRDKKRKDQKASRKKNRR